SWRETFTSNQRRANFSWVVGPGSTTVGSGQSERYKNPRRSWDSTLPWQRNHPQCASDTRQRISQSEIVRMSRRGLIQKHQQANGTERASVPARVTRPQKRSTFTPRMTLTTKINATGGRPARMKVSTIGEARP